MRVRSLAGAVVGVVLAIGISTTATALPSDQDQTWMVAAHQSNLTEIAAGSAAVAQATTDTVRQLGQMFIDMHTQLDADLTAAAVTLGVALPESPTPAQQAGLADVQAQQGAAFDTAWIANQIAGHRTTLAATQQELARGSNPTVLALATAATPVVEQHLASLEAAAAASGAPTLVQTGDGGLLADNDDGAGWWRIVLVGLGALLVLGGSTALARRRTS